MTSNLIVFAKVPKIGRVKTRLARGLTEEKAYEIYIDLLNRTKNLCKDWMELNHTHQVFWFWDIKNTENYLLPKNFHEEIQIQSQCLGERMEEAFRRVFFSFNTPSKVCIIGSDIPDLSLNILNLAFTMLNSKDVVIGPSKDGGYYLLGMKQFHKLFEDIEWSTNIVFQKTIQKIHENELSFDTLPMLADIDTLEDYLNWKESKIKV